MKMFGETGGSKKKEKKRKEMHIGQQMQHNTILMFNTLNNTHAVF